MKLTIGEAREFVRARLDELAAQESDMLLGAIDDRNLDNTVDKLLEDAITYIHLAAPASLMEGPILTESNFAPGDLSVRDGVIDIDTALADIGDDILRFISFQCGDSDIKLTRAFYEDSPEARMQLNEYIQGLPDSPALVRLDDSPNYKPHFKYYTTGMRLDGTGQLLHFVLRYFALPKLLGGSLNVSPGTLTFSSGMSTRPKTVSVSSTTPWRITSSIPDWLEPSETAGTGSVNMSFTVKQNWGAQRSVSLVFANDEGTATLEVTQKAYSNSEGDERLKVACTAMVDGKISLPSTEIGNVIQLRVAAENQLAWVAVLSDTTNFFLEPTTGIGSGIENYSTVALCANSINDTGVARTATITFSAVGVNPIVINIRQPAQLTVTPRQPSVGAEAGTLSFSIATESSWNIELLNPPEGFSLSAMEGTGNTTILCSYPKNEDAQTRFMGFRVSGGGATVQVTIAQGAATEQSISISPSTLGEYPASGNTEGMVTRATVTATGEWTIDTDTLPSWATIRRDPGTNNISVVSVNENTGNGKRSKVVTIYLTNHPEKTASLTISQAEKQGDITILDSESPLDTVTVPYTGGTYAATLNATGPWNLSSNKSWLHIISSTTGAAGTTTVRFTVDPGADADSATIVGLLTDGTNKTCDYYIIREAAPAVQEFLVVGRHPDNWLYNDQDVPNNGGGYGASLRASGPWSAAVASDSASWIHPSYLTTSPWSGGATESSTLWFNVDANPGPARTGTIVALLSNSNKQATFYVNQAGDGTITLSAAFSPEEVPAAGAEVDLNISTQAGVVWSIDNISSGLHPAALSGSGPDRITVTVDSASAARNLSLRVKSVAYNLNQTVSLHQNGPVSPSTSLTITPNGRKDIPSTQASQVITVRSNTSWIATCEDSSVNLSPSSGTNNASITATFGANESTTETRPIRITVSGGGISRELYLVQAAKTPGGVSADPSTIELPASGGSQLVVVSSSGNQWSLSKSASWIGTSINAGTTTMATSFTVSAEANTTGAPRTGTIILSAAGATTTVYVSQGASSGIFRVEPNTVTLEKTANSTGSVTVYAPDSWEVDENTSEIPDWLSYAYDSSHAGSQSGEGLTFTALTANNSDSPRTATIKLQLTSSPGEWPLTVFVSQAGNAILTVTPLNPTADSNADTGTINVVSNTDWSIISISEGLTFDEEDRQGTGNKSNILWSVTGNPLLVPRELSAPFRTADGTITRPFKITQAAGVFSVSPTSLSFAGSGETKSVILSSSSGWSVYNAPSWISARASTLVPNPEGAKVDIIATANNSASPRSGQITFRQNTYGHMVTVDVSQAPGITLNTLEINPDENYNLPDGDAATVEIEITSNTSWSVDISACYPGTTVSKNSGTGNDTIAVSVPINTNSLRRHHVVIKTTDNSISRELIIWQPVSGDDVSFEPDIDHMTFSEDVPTGQVTVISNRDWTAASNGSWLLFSPDHGSAFQAVTVTFNPRINLLKGQSANWTVTTVGGATKTISCRTFPPTEPFEPINK